MPKGNIFSKFARRKSAGNELDAQYERANVKPEEEKTTGSFRVIPRPNRGSQNTNSTFSGYGTDNGSSNRLSSTSTLPSADSIRTPDDYRPPHPLGQHKTSDSNGSLFPYGHHKPPIRHSATAAVGALLHRSHQDPEPVQRVNSHPMLAAPHLEAPSLDSSSLFGGDDMFDFMKPKQKKMQEETGRGVNNGLTSVTTGPKVASNDVLGGTRPHVTQPSPTATRPSASRMTTSNTTYSNMFTTSSHMDSDRPTIDTEASPYHWDPNPSPGSPSLALLSHSDSNDNSPRNSRMLTPGQRQRPFAHSRNDSLEAPNGHSRPKHRATGGLDAGMKRTSAVRRASLPQDDIEPVRIRADKPSNSSLQAHGKDRDSGWGDAADSSNNSIRSVNSSQKDAGDTAFTTPLISRGNTDNSVKKPIASEASGSTPQVKRYELSDVQSSHSMDDDDDNRDLAALANAAVQYESNGPAPDMPGTKRMTKAQYDRYQQQEDEKRRLQNKRDDDSDSDHNTSEEDEDLTEMEKSKQAAILRAKQEAHLAVYRQQMKKVSGSFNPEQSVLGMSQESRSLSALNQLNGAQPWQSTPEEEDPDEDVPLGILAAHGFPNKNRPPTRLASSSSQPDLRGLANRGSQLPPFAQRLPADPYNIGASIVNQTERMMPYQRAESVVGMPTGPGSVYGMPPSHVPLVGQIQIAEQQKAARRGTGTGYTPPPDPFATPDPFANRLGGGQGMLGMGRQSMMVPNGQNPMAQNQMMMQQMMDMQMQMMQMQMGGQNPAMLQQQQQMLMMQQQMGMNGMGGMGTNGRPMSMMPPQTAPSLRAPSIMGVPPMQQQYGQKYQQPPQTANSLFVPGFNAGLPQLPQHRPMSMLNAPAPGSSAGRPGSAYSPSLRPVGNPGYVPSIAPSERSNVGLPQRYRPVSFVGGSQGPGSASGRTGTMRSGGALGGSGLRQTAVREEEEEDEEWGKMKEKREARKKKGGLKGMLGMGAEKA